MIRKFVSLTFFLPLLASACAVDTQDVEHTDVVQLAADNGSSTDITTRDQCLSGCAASLEYCLSTGQSLPPGETCESKSRDCVDYCFDVFTAIIRPKVILKPPSVVLKARL